MSNAMICTKHVSAIDNVDYKGSMGQYVFWWTTEYMASGLRFHISMV